LPQYANDRFRDDFSSPTIESKVSTISYGGVLHALSWVSVYYNYAETFVPPASGLTLTGSTVPPGMSEGWDAGVRFSLLEGRLSASFGKYDSTQLFNSYDATGRVSKYQVIAAANKVGDLSVNGYNGRGLPLVGQPSFDFRDRKARGYEIDIVANLTPQWRLTANAGFPEVLRTNEDQDQWAYLRANEATLRQIVVDAGVTINASNVATVDTSVPVGNRSPDAAAAATAWNDIQNFKATSNPMEAVLTDLPKFTANVYTDYRFARGFLKNLRIGAGVQYVGQRAIGNRGADTIVSPANPTLAIDDPSVDVNTRIYMRSYYTGTVNLSYKFRLKQSTMVTLSLNIRNVLDNTDPIFISSALRAPGGDITRPDRVTVPATFIYRSPRSFELASSFSF
jgi:outer membrane receptor for ferric coprogen and ferric-rhodotorulic acid